MSPILSVLACDRGGCQHKSNGDEWSWWGLYDHKVGWLQVARFIDSMKRTEGWRFFCGQECALKEISDWMAQQREGK